MAACPRDAGHGRRSGANKSKHRAPLPGNSILNKISTNLFHRLLSHRAFSSFLLCFIACILGGSATNPPTAATSGCPAAPNSKSRSGPTSPRLSDIIFPCSASASNAAGTPADMVNNPDSALKYPNAKYLTTVILTARRDEPPPARRRRGPSTPSSPSLPHPRSHLLRLGARGDSRPHLCRRLGSTCRANCPASHGTGQA